MPAGRISGYELRGLAQMIQVTLQNEDGGQLIHHLAAAPAALVRLDQHPLGRSGGEAFIPENDLYPQGLAQGAGELHDFRGRGHRAAVQVPAPAYHNLLHGIIPADLKEAVQVRLPIPADPNLQPLGRDPQRITHRQADALGAHVHAENSPGLTLGERLLGFHN